MILQRLMQTGDSLLGIFKLGNGFPVCLSLENYAKCIPGGEYPLSFESSPRFGDDCLSIGCVHNRTGIRIHAANWPDELEGCIAPGSFLYGKYPHFGVGASAVALNQLKHHARDCSRILIEDLPHA